MITSQFTAGAESDFTMNAAMSTAGMPPMASPMMALASNFFSRMKRALAVGMRKAQEPIMIGNAVVAFMPRRLTRIMHGAYRPMPMVISAPRMKFPTRPMMNFVPSSPSELLPAGSMLLFFAMKMAANTR